MKVAKANAYTTPGTIAPLITPVECAKLFTLPALAFKLFVCLVHCVDFKTGNGQAGYPDLIAMLTPAQPERGRPLPVPTRDEVKHMLRRLIDLGLIARDKGASEDCKRVIFHMPPRSWEAVSGELAARLTARRENGANPDEHRAKSRRARTSRPTNRPGIQKEFTYIKEPENAKLSTGPQDEHHAPPEGEKMAPPGGQNIGPDGPRPPPEALTDTGEGAGEGSHQGPPGGRELALPGLAPGELGEGERILLAQQQASELERARAEWKAERAHQPPTVQVDDPSTWQKDELGRLILPVDHPTHKAQKAGRGLRRVSWS